MRRCSGPRIPKPYAHKGWYHTNAGGVQGCKVEEGLSKATRLPQTYPGSLVLAAEGGSHRPVGAGIRADVPGDKPVGEVHDEFLDVKRVEAEDLHLHYVQKLKPFLERFSAWRSSSPPRSGRSSSSCTGSAAT